MSERRLPVPVPIPPRTPDVDPAPSVPPSPAPKPKKPAKPKPKKPRKPKPAPEPPVKRWALDWYAVGLLLLGAIAVAPYVSRALKELNIFQPNTPVAVYDASAEKVGAWFSLVGSDDPKAEVPKYVESLRAVAVAAKAGEFKEYKEIFPKLQDEVEARLTRKGWLDWSLFTLQLFHEARSLREAGNLTKVDTDFAAFLEAIAGALEKKAE